jgi:phosphoserine phosphatase
MTRARMALIGVEMGCMSKSAVDHVATFVAAEGFALTPAVLAAALARAGCADAPCDWLEPDVAADVRLSLAPPDARAFVARLEAALAPAPVDVILQPHATRRKALLVADMDSTTIAQECIDELADALGLKDRIAPITERAMRGDIAFEDALRARLALLAGLRVDALRDILAARISFSPGAATLVATMRAAGAHIALVSGGFAQIVEPVAATLGCHESHANRPVVNDGALTGALGEPVLGALEKAQALEDMRAARGLALAATLAIGDGANDVPMLRAAGLGVAWRAKPRVADAADARLDHADLTALLYAQGFRRRDFVASDIVSPLP